MHDVIHLTKDNFHEWLNNNPQAIVDFWAPWCGPCKTLTPLFAKVAEESIKNQQQTGGKKIGFAKINVEDEPELANQFKIRSLPTLITFKDGKTERMQMGMVSKQLLEYEIENLSK